MHSVIARLPARDHLTRRRGLAASFDGDARSALWSFAPRVPTLHAVRPTKGAHASKSPSRSARSLGAFVAREHRRTRFRTASPARLTRLSDTCAAWTREPGARPCHLGLEGGRPRAGHPDVRAGSLALAAGETFRVSPSRTESVSTPMSAFARSSGNRRIALDGDATETLAPVRSSSRPPPRVTAGRPSFELGRACPAALFTLPGVAIEDAFRPTSALRTNTTQHPCLVCSRCRDRPARAGEGPSRSEACASCSLSTRTPRGVASITLGALRRERVHRGARGPPMRSETGDTRASRRANRWASRSRSRGGVFVRSTRSNRPRPWRLCRLLRSRPQPANRPGLETKAAEIESACSSRERGPRSLDPRRLPSPRATHTPSTRSRTYTGCAASLSLDRSRDEDRSSERDRPSVHRLAGRGAYALRSSRRLGALRWGRTVDTELPFTRFWTRPPGLSARAAPMGALL